MIYLAGCFCINIPSVWYKPTTLHAHRLPTFEGKFFTQTSLKRQKHMLYLKFAFALALVASLVLMNVQERTKEK